MEFVEIFKELITSVGFPIACCVVLFMQNNKFVDAINSNTEALKSLIEKVDDLDNDIK